ncbi:MAG: DUF3604 domain-containing protein [Pseudomonadales bacterium]|nr:DUF3604 domain-containing protein [Pseudomonadales bacterium]MDP6469763.1 DUF3604 domain-containing protein [Pseudomonadales bacterium]MDP6827635.1 DUF3604 domain-containing protein [Pseudomonadales bacterium]
MKHKIRCSWVLCACTLLLAACSTPEKPVAETAQAPTPSSAEEEQAQTAGRRFGGAQLKMPADVITGDASANAKRNAYFGDLHVHTDYSFDAYAFGTVATPYDAYKYAKGQPIRHPAGFEVKLRKPLDFYAVTDHAMFLGGVKAAADTSTAFSRLPHVQALHNLNAPENQNLESLPQRGTAFGTFLPETLRGVIDGSIDAEMVNQIAQDAWADIVTAAQTHYQPGTFTTFVAYEYTSSTDDRGNLHRNVVFRDDDKLPAMPFSRFHSQDPEGLWDWMDGLRAQGIEALAIPHNSNGSNGQMFKLVDWAGDPLNDTYTKKRIRNEPLVEITQVKGTSETHPALSDTDEWADFEIMPYRIATTLHSEPQGSYARDALLKGLSLRDKGITNPYQFGFVGASDTHTAAASLDEGNYFSKVGLLDADSQRRGSVPLSAAAAEIIESAGRVNLKEVDGKTYASGAFETWGASGITGVWAEENTRAAIYDAFRRKETFATSGPRMKVRFFGGYGFDAALLANEDHLTQAYHSGVSMGSELLANGGKAPDFVAWATRDANSAALQRLQIVKGWSVNGEHHEHVYDVACSDGGAVDADTHRCPDNGAGVDLTDCSITEGVGAGELATVWSDPDFDPAHRAFYYVRALENPTCRWSTWDAIKAGVPPRADLKSTIQERVWSSPIWYIPDAG